MLTSSRSKIQQWLRDSSCLGHGLGDVGDVQPYGAVRWEVPWVCICTQLCTPGIPSGCMSGKYGGKTGPLVFQSPGLLPTLGRGGSWHSFPFLQLQWPVSPRGSGREDPWPPCPLGAIICSAQGCVGATETCGAWMQAVSREDASRWCSSPCCLALRFAKVRTRSYHLVLRSILLVLPSSLELGALYITWFRGWRSQLVRTD